MVNKIVSGGQTGADRGGLEAARVLGIQTGGYCPKGYLTEQGPDLSLRNFNLTESESKDYSKRTIKNIEISDGTVLFADKTFKGEIAGRGTRLTFNTCKELRKPVIINPSRDDFIRWIIDNKIKTLNVAGNRESKNKGLQVYVKQFLINSLGEYVKTVHDATKEYSEKFVKLSDKAYFLCDMYGKYKGIHQEDILLITRDSKVCKYKVLEIKYFSPHSEEFFGKAHWMGYVD